MADKDGLAEKIDKLLSLHGIGGEAEQIKISVLWAAWFKGMQLKSEATRRSAEGSWKHLEPIIGNMTLPEMSGELWTNTIIPEVRKQSTSPQFIFFNMRKWLGMFFKWCEENNKSHLNWRKPKLIDPDPERAKGRVYTPEESARMYECADWTLLAKLIMGFEHMMRRNEIARLSKNRVDRTRRVIHLRAQDTKIRKARSFPYNESLEWCFVILDYLAAKNGTSHSPWIFPSPLDPMKSIGQDGFATAWQTCKRRAGVTGKSNFHYTRHTGLTRACRAPGANLAKISEFAGLRIEELMRTYVHLEIDDLRDVLKTS